MSAQISIFQLLENLHHARVLCIGDVILDHFHYGSVNRVSPEAPIPVLKLERKVTMLGGAGNVVRNLAGLGAQVNFTSVIGKDPEGAEIKRLIREEGLVDMLLVDDGARQTSVKTRYLADGQQILRTDHESIFTLSHNIEEKLIAKAVQAMQSCDAVILSDYAKGVLTDKTIVELIRAAKVESKVVIVDPKGIDYGRYRGADIITPNRRELFEATGMPTDSDGEVTLAAQSLIDKYSFGSVLATRSMDGMTLLKKDGGLSHLRAESIDVFDVSGAGDTVVATLAAAISAGADIEDAARLANVAAGIVVGKVGTAVVFTKDFLTELLHQDQINSEAKILGLEPALDRLDKWRRDGNIVGFTNGCFDLLHPGHISLLNQAQDAADKLVVGLNSDASVKLLKGDERPVQSELARAIILASLSAVDMVIIFSEETPIKLIEELRPDVLVKGADYTLRNVVGSDIVSSYGGRVLLAEIMPGHSTTGTIAKLGRDAI
jgi:D-beta-D-heptose 7-phosphate kinase / D-beta-D-heptose 1-phosphate adenosyltransferase